MSAKNGAAKPTPEELRSWVTTVLAREQEAGTYGQVTFFLEGGRIVRSRVERSEFAPGSSPHLTAAAKGAIG